MLYSNNANGQLVSNKASTLDTMIQGQNNASYRDVWQPLIISNDNYIQNKLLSSHGSYHHGNPLLQSCQLGIENIYSFSPQFKSWTVSGGTMSIDWMLNTPNTAYSLYYGILCWFRTRNVANNPNIHGGLAKPLSYFPNGSRLMLGSGGSTSIYIKLNNQTLYMVGGQSKTLKTDGTWQFNAELGTTIVLLTSLGTNPLFKLADQHSTEDRFSTQQSETHTMNLNPALWVADGDCFFYFNSEDEKIQSVNSGIPSRSYISSGLYQKYSAIYRILTLDEKRTFGPKNLRRSRCYKRIAHALSTSPFIDEFSIDALDSGDIKSLINNHMISQASIRSVDSEIFEFKTLLLRVSRFLQNTSADTTNKSLYLDTKFSTQTLNNNLIYSESELFKKLMSKYGAYLRISSPSVLSAKTDVLKFDNKGIAVTQVLDSYCSKTLRNTAVNNNQKIIFDNTTVETKLNAYDTHIDILVGGQKKNTIPLYDSAKPTHGSDPGNSTSFCPTLGYKGDVQGMYRTDGRPYNEYADRNDYVYETPVDNGAEINLVNAPQDLAHCSYLLENGIKLNASSIIPVINSWDEPSILIAEDYIEGLSSYLWEQLEGPTGTFGKSKLLSGASNDVTFYTSYTGKYVFQCTISSPFGSFKKQRTVYVVDGRQLVLGSDNNNQPIMLPNSISYRKYWNSTNRTWESPPAVRSPSMISESNTILLDKDSVKPTVCKLNKVVISNYHGIFWPIKTNLSVRQYVGSIGAANQDEVYNLEKDYIFKYDNMFQYQEQSSFSLAFIPNNTVIKLHSVWLEKIRTDQEECAQCLSLYLPKIRSQKLHVKLSSADGIITNNYDFNKTLRANKADDGFTLRSYEFDAATNRMVYVKEEKSFLYPQITTTKAPKIKTYGGYNRGFVDSVGISVNGLRPPLRSVNDTSLVAGSPNYLPNVTGYPMNYKNDLDSSTYKMCYQQPVMVSGTGTIMPFSKGVFHPNSGWIPYSGGNSYSTHANKCGVLKFNPGARDSFSFIGPQITQLKCGSSSVENNTIQPRTLSSSITLGIAKYIQWDTVCTCGEIKPEMITALYNDNQKHKDYVDIKIANNNSNHGYRILAGGEPKGIEATATNNSSIVNDEFLTQQDATNFSYDFAVTGPNTVPEQARLPDGRLQFRIPRVNGFGIKDIEVKLNFLNYVNTKNIAVWLEVEHCSEETQTRFKKPRSGLPPSPLRAYPQFVDQTSNPQIFFGEYSTNQNLITNSITNSGVENYLKGLLEMNGPSGVSNAPFKLFLLNQETVQNNNYNFSVKFSDHASKSNVPCDMNFQQKQYSTYLTSQQSAYQNIIRSNNDLLPTIMITGYSDRESCEYSSIIKHNKLNINNNNFTKFVSNILFKNAAPDSGPCIDGTPKQLDGDFDGKTKFTLNIMVLDEEDDMTVNDNTVNSQYLSGLETVENNTKSRLLYNSLCNWELILHVGSVRDPIPNTNPSLASYGNNDPLSLIEYKRDPSYPGNSFIADLSQFKHLLPIANYDAPYSCISDSNLCLTSQDDPTGQGVMVRPPEFPAYAILQIMAGLAGYAGSTGGTLVGALAGMEGAVNSPGYNLLFNYFKESAWAAGLVDQGRQIYTPSYAKYPFGSSEKILINFKKPNSLWYTAEASIFKYHNTPILKPNRYNFIRLSRGSCGGLVDFSFNVVKSYKELVDSRFIKNIPTSCDSEIPSNLSTPSTFSNILVNDGDIVDVSFTGVDCARSGESYVVKNNSEWIRLDPTRDISGISQASHYLQHNAVLGFNSNVFNNTLHSSITSSGVVMISGRMPYDILKKDDIITCYGTATTGTQQILSKGLIFKNNSYHSVFVLGTNMSQYSTVTPGSGIDLLLVYKNETTVQDERNKKYNIWGIDSSYKNILKNTTDIYPTTHSVGSYGDMSLFVSKNVLSNNNHANKLENIKDILDNRNNDKIKYNNIKLFNNTGGSNLVQVNGYNLNSICGYSYAKEDLNMNLVFRDEKQNKDFYFIKPDTMTEDQAAGLDSQISNASKLSSSYNDLPNSFSIIRPEYSNGPLSTGIQNGELELQNDYYEYKPMRNITLEELNLLVSRLSIIDNTATDTALENIIGTDTSTQTILNSSKLNYIIKHYNKLKDDPPDCNTQSPANTNLCYKKKTKIKIQDLYEERREILQLLNDQAIRQTSVTYKVGSSTRTAVGELLENDNDYIITTAGGKTTIPKTDVESISFTYTLKSLLPDDSPNKINPVILPKIEPVISGAGPIYISYRETNKDHYWINIDPKQSCFQDFAANPKVLVSVKYKCIEANPAFVYSANIDNNVCPFFTTKPEQSLQFSPGLSENLTLEGDYYKYTINSAAIESQKTAFQSQYPAITGWKNFIKTRYFNINGDQTMDTLMAQGAEVTVEAIESYFVPLADENQGNYSSGDTLELSGIGSCQTTIGSPGGKGLINTDGNRVGKPTRVENIVNLNNANDISVMVKRIPRMLRGVDLLSTVYRYGSKAEFRASSFTSPPVPYETDLANAYGNINNSLYFWVALQRNKESNGLESCELPDFFKLQNEMIFRSFFGSVDKIENKLDVAASYFPWELIPYEYE
jgi:hypothetical protein